MRIRILSRLSLDRAIPSRTLFAAEWFPAYRPILIA
jgi:hypothetical protein